MIQLTMLSPRSRAESEALFASIHPTTITPATVPVTEPTPAAPAFNIRMFNQTINTPKTPNPPASPVSSPDYGAGVIGQIVEKFPGGSNVFPDRPRSPYLPTKMLNIKSRLLALKRRPTPLQGIKERTGAAGVQAPSASEKTTHMTIPAWQNYLSSIPKEARSVSPRQAAMSPRIDDRSPTNLAANVMAPSTQLDEAGVSPGMQLENTSPIAGVTDFTFLILVGVFGFLILKRGRA